jgi:hypothetical protein
LFCHARRSIASHTAFEFIGRAYGSTGLCTTKPSTLPAGFFPENSWQTHKNNVFYLYPQKLIGVYIKMSCTKTKECVCPKTDCPRHKNCCACIVNHRETDSVPFCMFPDNEGDKSMEGLYRKLKARFEGADS